MGFEKKIENKKVVEQIEYSAKDFLKLEEELDKYCIEKEITLDGKTRMVRYVSTEGMIKWFSDKGATTIDFSVKNIPLFRELQDKLDQYYNWVRRKEYAIRMQAINNENLVETLVDKYTDF